jgi:hypothetical protein
MLNRIIDRISTCSDQHVDLNSFCIRDKWVPIIIECVNNNPKIIWLDLNNNCIADEGAKLLAKFLIRIVSIDLIDNWIGTEGLLALLDNPQFYAIRIGNNFSVKNPEIILPKILDNRTCRMLDVINTCFTWPQLDVIKAHCLENVELYTKHYEKIIIDAKKAESSDTPPLKESTKFSETLKQADSSSSPKSCLKTFSVFVETPQPSYPLQELFHKQTILKKS